METASGVGTLPTFLIIGAQKCATRWLKVNLGRHPDVFCATGEPSFFNAPERDVRAYAQCFAQRTTESAIGEATPGYMMWRNSPRRIARRIDALLPGVRLIALVRDPVDRTHSAFFHHMRMERIEPDTDLLEHVHSVAPERDPLSLIAGGWYGRSLEPFAKRFGDRLLVLSYDEIATDPAGPYELALRHIGVDPRYRPGTLRRPVGARPAADDGGPGVPGRGPALTPDERAALFTFFAEDVERLERLIGADLAAWRPVRPRTVPGRPAKPDRHRYLFLMACPRSGASALARLLNADPRIAMGIERFKYLRGRIRREHFRREHFLNPTPDETNILRPRVYRELAAKWDAGGIELVGDKVAGFREREVFADLLDEFPGCRFVFPLRELTPVASSYIGRAADPADVNWPPHADHRRAVRHWNASLGNLRALVEDLGAGDRVHVLVYERFWAGRREELESLLCFLGLDVHRDVDDAYAAATRDWSRRVARSLALDGPARELVEREKRRELESWARALAGA